MPPFRPFREPASPRIVFAHIAYGFSQAFRRRNLTLPFTEVRSVEDLAREMPEADVVVASGLWRRDLLPLAPHLALVQSISVGLNTFDLDQFRAAGVRLANASGANTTPVAEHALALTLALSRHIHTARDNQARTFWRPMIGDATVREFELAGRTMLVVGLGPIGERIAGLAKAFGMSVIGARRTVAVGSRNADRVVAFGDLATAVPKADVLVLACPLTPETERLVDERLLSALKPTAMLVNVARGRVVDEPALIAALETGRLAAAALDVTSDEPLPAASPLWRMPNVLVTPHAAGETQAYEDRIIDLALENIARVREGRDDLVNRIV